MDQDPGLGEFLPRRSANLYVQKLYVLLFLKMKQKTTGYFEKTAQKFIGAEKGCGVVPF